MLSSKIKEYRKDNGLTLEEFADKLFVTRNSVSKWENDNVYPKSDTIKDIAKLLNISIEELFGEDISIYKTYKLNKYKNYVSNILIFIIFLLVTILMPHIKLLSNQNVIYYFVSAPIIFLLLGIVTPFCNRDMAGSFISGALAMILTLIYYKVTTNNVIHMWKISYYIIFVISYYIMLRILNKNNKH